MTASDIMSEKTLIREKIKSKFNLPKRSKTLIALYFSDSDMTQSILSGLDILPANFIIVGGNIDTSEAKNIVHIKKIEEIDMQWIDALVCDCKDISLEKIMSMWVVPIVIEKNYLWKILSEFSAARGEGNAYLYQDFSYWSAYYALVRYLENMKFPYDNRNLVKNVIWV